MSVLKLFFSPKGRISRTKFCIALWVLIVIYANISDYSKSKQEFHSVILVIFNILIYWSVLSVFIKRFHDMNRSGWYSLFIVSAVLWILTNIILPNPNNSLLSFFYSIFGIVSVLGAMASFLYCIFAEGTNYDNKYGTNSNYKEQQSQNNKKEPDQSSNNLFISESDKHLISMLAKIAKSDGVVSQQEIKVIDNFFTEILKLNTKERKKYIIIFSNAKTSSMSFVYHCKEYYKLNKYNNDLLKAVLELCVLVAFADGKLSAEEDFLINEIIEIFGIESQTYNSYKQKYNNYQTSDTDKTEQYHLNVLGLDESASFDDIKNAYKRLANQYHPDKVAHLGDKLKEVAAEEMKKINEAYEYLKNNYNY